ncbi:MAG: DUF350 domain-containing protein [Gemmatimonadetes bacterium]|nr:DUF350 domain-containing protein [Gemmatimonadota bacterium]
MFEEYLIPMAWSVGYILEAFILLWIAKFAYTRIYRRVDLKAELFERGNHALAVSIAGYLFGIIIAFGGVLEETSAGWKADLVGIASSGILAILLMLVASFMCEKLLLPHFDNTREIVEKHNLGTSFVEAGVHIANGMIVLAISQGGQLAWEGIAFWILAQLVLILVGVFYEWATPHKIHHEISRSNAAVGLAFGGALVGMGNVVSIASSGDFEGWQTSLTSFASYVIFGIFVLFIIKKLTDFLLAPGVKLSAEQSRDTPNIGAGLIEALGYVGASMLIIWVL